MLRLTCDGRRVGTIFQQSGQGQNDMIYVDFQPTPEIMLIVNADRM